MVTNKVPKILMSMIYRRELCGVRYHEHPLFFLDLPWTPDGLELWNTMKHYQPEILTGVTTDKESRKQKYNWCLREFNNFNNGNKVTVNHVDMAGRNFSHNLVNNGLRWKRENNVVNVITCWSMNKHYESGHNRVLIDDRSVLRAMWERKGGIFIHHTDTKSTLLKLKKAGIIGDQSS